jgi:hypothetical protein
MLLCAPRLALFLVLIPGWSLTADLPDLVDLLIG